MIAVECNHFVIGLPVMKVSRISSICREGYIYYMGDGMGRVKIGFSANPWSRCKESRTFCPGLTLLAIEKAKHDQELYRQEDFKEDHLALEWFRLSPRLEKFIHLLNQQSILPVPVLAEKTHAANDRSVEARESTTTEVGSGCTVSSDTDSRGGQKPFDKKAYQKEYRAKNK